MLGNKFSILIVLGVFLFIPFVYAENHSDICQNISDENPIIITTDNDNYSIQDDTMIVSICMSPDVYHKHIELIIYDAAKNEVYQIFDPGFNMDSLQQEPYFFVQEVSLDSFKPGIYSTKLYASGIVSTTLFAFGLDANSETNEVSPIVTKLPTGEYSDELLHFKITLPENWVKIGSDTKPNETISLFQSSDDAFTDFQPLLMIHRMPYVELPSSDVETWANNIVNELLNAQSPLDNMSIKNTDIEYFEDKVLIKFDGTINLPEASDKLLHFEGISRIDDYSGMYTLILISSDTDYPKYSQIFQESASTFDIVEPEFLSKQTEMNEKEITETITQTFSQDEGGGCLIATAAFGSELAPQIQQLREIRDNGVLSTSSGTAFMTGFNQFYYSFSPSIADWERQNPVFKELVKIAITPLLSTLSILNYLDMDSEAKVLLYGSGIIILNIGIYFVLPIIIVIKLRKLNFRNIFVNMKNIIQNKSNKKILAGLKMIIVFSALVSLLVVPAQTSYAHFDSSQGGEPVNVTVEIIAVDLKGSNDFVGDDEVMLHHQVAINGHNFSPAGMIYLEDLEVGYNNIPVNEFGYDGWNDDQDPTKRLFFSHDVCSGSDESLYITVLAIEDDSSSDELTIVGAIIAVIGALALVVVTAGGAAPALWAIVAGSAATGVGATIAEFGVIDTFVFDNDVTPILQGACALQDNSWTDLDNTNEYLGCDTKVIPIREFASSSKQITIQHKNGEEKIEPFSTILKIDATTSSDTSNQCQQEMKDIEISTSIAPKFGSSNKVHPGTELKYSLTIHNNANFNQNVFAYIQFDESQVLLEHQIRISTPQLSNCSKLINTIYCSMILTPGDTSITLYLKVNDSAKIGNKLVDQSIVGSGKPFTITGGDTIHNWKDEVKIENYITNSENIVRDSLDDPPTITDPCADKQSVNLPASWSILFGTAYGQDSPFEDPCPEETEDFTGLDEVEKTPEILCSESTGSTEYGGILFKDDSFADTVIRYDTMFSGGPIPEGDYAQYAIGNPDDESVALGNGGLMEVKFTNNVLVNSGDDTHDLYIFEVGGYTEGTSVSIRPTSDTRSLLGSSYDENGDGFYEIGKVSGSTSSIDIDSFFPSAESETYKFDAVQLIDILNQDGLGEWPGADIDAVGAISSKPECTDASTVPIIQVTDSYVDFIEKDSTYPYHYEATWHFESKTGESLEGVPVTLQEISELGESYYRKTIDENNNVGMWVDLTYSGAGTDVYIIQPDKYYIKPGQDIHVSDTGYYLVYSDKGYYDEYDLDEYTIPLVENPRYILVPGEHDKLVVVYDP